MTATLRFDLPDDNEDYVCAVKAADLRGAILDILDYLRTHEKHTDNSKLPKLPEIRQECYRIIEERGLGELMQ